MTSRYKKPLTIRARHTSTKSINVTSVSNSTPQTKQNVTLYFKINIDCYISSFLLQGKTEQWKHFGGHEQPIILYVKCHMPFCSSKTVIKSRSTDVHSGTHYSTSLSCILYFFFGGAGGFMPFWADKQSSGTGKEIK